MLKKENRLSNLKRKVESKNYDTPLFKIKISQNSENKNRFGFVVSKKIDKKAVVRNQTKRVLKKAAKSFLGKISEDKDIIFVSKKVLKNVDFNEARILIEGVFKRSQILK